jgi:hypothetical protein
VLYVFLCVLLYLWLIFSWLRFLKPVHYRTEVNRAFTVKSEVQCVRRGTPIGQFRTKYRILFLLALCIMWLLWILFIPALCMMPFLYILCILIPVLCPVFLFYLCCHPVWCPFCGFYTGTLCNAAFLHFIDTDTCIMSRFLILFVLSPCIMPFLCILCWHSL